MPALKSHVASEKADVAMTANAAVAIKVLDNVVMRCSSGLTSPPANRAPCHRTPIAGKAEMPIPNRFDSERVSGPIAPVYRSESERAFQNEHSFDESPDIAGDHCGCGQHRRRPDVQASHLVARGLARPCHPWRIDTLGAAGLRR